jgi:hypothetical protein
MIPFVHAGVRAEQRIYSSSYSTALQQASLVDAAASSPCCRSPCCVSKEVSQAGQACMPSDDGDVDADAELDVLRRDRLEDCDETSSSSSSNLRFRRDDSEREIIRTSIAE